MIEFLISIGIRAIGIDKNSQLSSPSRDIRLGDIHALPFEDRSFNVAYSFGIFDSRQYMLDQETVFGEVKRVLRPEGLYLIQDFDQPNLALARGFEICKSSEYISILKRI